jgi:hypothetical protein
MAKILGIGGIFFTSKDPEALKKWYHEMLGIESNEFASIFMWDTQATIAGGMTLWAPFSEDTTYFAPSEKKFMINFVVDHLDDLVEHLKSK